MSSTNTQRSSWKDLTVKTAKQKQGLELLAGSIATQQLQAEAERQRINIAAEDAAARQAMGWPDMDSGEEMNQTIIGDVTHPTVVQTEPKSKGLNPFLAMAFGALGPIGLIAGQYLASDAPKPEPIQKVINTTNDVGDKVNLGLNRIGDLR